MDSSFFNPFISLVQKIRKTHMVSSSIRACELFDEMSRERNCFQSNMVGLGYTGSVRRK
ncbi:hypothetical protein M6B38_102465 [Iris pallida]|uniref:Pentatricopeptide repeat-containing protein n=1 Tax=Iris pallida TaxID=29817 RepID=A0AAX6G7Y3_IRIPA|nr:hypothetical protein M6B38_153385 [Iris pallida]KAJ6824291.1 hypothetical protein M6B38_102465 [Iris pallida]